MLLGSCGHQETLIWDTHGDVSEITILSYKIYKNEEKIEFTY